MVNFQPSAGQVAAYDLMMKWYESSAQYFVLAGYAGTGKSTLAAQIESQLGVTVAYCAYTGKAANVLREKGVDYADTLHGWLYDINGAARRKLEQLQTKLLDFAPDSAEAEDIKNQIADIKQTLKQPQFKLNIESEIRNFDLVIVDEYSMLDDKIISDLLQVARKVLFIGDPYQLPPVKGECSLQPDYFLDEIHRQAADSGIIRISKRVRDGESIDIGNYGDLVYYPRHKIKESSFMAADQLIVGRNKTRHAMNAWYREKLGYLTPLPSAGEKLICLKNNKVLGLYNGMIGHARTSAKNCGLYYHLEFDNMKSMRVYADDARGKESTYNYDNPAHAELERFTYAYAITCHKSQGSEFNNLIVINEPVGQERQRWLYTAITRAKQKCILVEPKR